MALENGYLASWYIIDKEPCLREYTNSVALAMCAKVDGREGGGVEAAARGARRRWLELILVTCPKLCSTGELEALVQPVENLKGQCRWGLHRHAPWCMQTVLLAM